MEKIFEKDTIKYLQELGISNQEIQKLQLKELKEKSLSILRKVVESIEKEEFSNIDPYLAYSPSGDEMGCDNRYINFGPICSESESMDISELVNFLEELKRNTK